MTGYEDVLIRISTPYGIVDVGWKPEKKDRCSNINCLLCPEEKPLETFGTLTDFSRHLVKEHFEVAWFALLKSNFWKMVV